MPTITPVLRSGSASPLTAAQYDGNWTAAAAAIAASVETTDPRLSNARVPTAHQHPLTDLPEVVTALAAKASTATVATLSTTVDGKAATNDSRFTDRRLPIFVNSPTRAPLVTDDSNAGYSVAHLWQWGSRLWVAASVGVGAAVWIEIGLTTAQLASLALANTALQPASQLPAYIPLDITGAATNLDNNHNLSALRLTAGSVPTLTVRTQANYAWAATTIFTAGTDSGAFRVVFPTGVSVNGVANKTIESAGGAAGVTVYRRATDQWVARGSFTVL